MAEDLFSNDKTKQQLLAMPTIKKSIFGLNPKLMDDSKFLFIIFETLIKNLSSADLEKVGLEMINTFKNNISTYKKEYEHPELTKQVKNHPSTKEFIKEAKTALENCIKNNIDEIKNKDDYGRKEMLTKHKEIINYINGKYLPLFNDVANMKKGIVNIDILKGLTILIDSIWSLQVYVKNLKIKGSDISYELYFEIYDHFVLDYSDIEKVADKHNGFNCWYILQHYNRYKYTPFITKINFLEKVIK